jgi:hypothetical protein
MFGDAVERFEGFRVALGPPALDGEEIPNPFVDFVAKLPRRLGYNLGP